MLSDMIRLILENPSRSMADIALESLNHMHRLWPDVTGMPEYMDMIRRAVDMACAADQPDRVAINALGEGWVGDEAMAIAVYCAVRYPDDLAACIRAGVNHSGDSDSTGAIAGNLVGTRLGAIAINADWTEPLDVRESIIHTSQQLTELAAQGLSD